MVNLCRIAYSLLISPLSLRRVDVGRVSMVIMFKQTLGDIGGQSKEPERLYNAQFVGENFKTDLWC